MAVKLETISWVWVVKRPQRTNNGETSVCIPSVLYGVNNPKCTIWAFGHNHDKEPQHYFVLLSHWCFSGNNDISFSVLTSCVSPMSIYWYFADIKAVAFSKLECVYEKLLMLPAAAWIRLTRVLRLNQNNKTMGCKTDAAMSWKTLKCSVELRGTVRSRQVMKSLAQYLVDHLT